MKLDHIITLAKQDLTNKLNDLANHFNADVISYTGHFFNGIEKTFLNIIESLVADGDKKDKIYIILTSTGGSANAVERCVNILRYHYEEVHFIVPDYAYSAGTIFCMSGDSIFMDYYSVLGPIDPQIQNREGKFVPALGYLDKINEMLEKSKTGDLTQPEFLILKDFDLAELRSYEQARELSVALLKKWLVKFKFKNWDKHTTTNIGSPVTDEDKERRAEEIANDLSNNNKWKSHGRPINIETLEKDIRLKINDYSLDPVLSNLIRSYNELLNSFLEFTNNQGIFIHTKNHF
ncbi:SDH family Clp fold serine proteinase [Chryseobacterium binzhouense]|uniref:SDH family Clp fold serine proteinase n=1 Tax=Chryseobacterium binzhouense TaxID=2593646 RepID=UPI00117BFABB|nr:ATP-dependent Clp protease proteolytic subunit [Chryseobacterium binzhouense]MXS71384.1 serine dehydrogenasease [Flavobacteriaceae bacterium W22]